MKFRCRTKIPAETLWVEIAADDPEQAAMEYFFQHDLVRIVHVRTIEGKRESVLFALVEVEGHGEWIARVFRRDLWRKGGVKLRRQTITIEDVARQLGWTGDPEELLSSGWPYEDQEWK